MTFIDFLQDVRTQMFLLCTIACAFGSFTGCCAFMAGIWYAERRHQRTDLFPHGITTTSNQS
jgi:hypothetical protein